MRERVYRVFINTTSCYGSNRSIIEIVKQLKRNGERVVVYIPEIGPVIQLLNEFNIDFQVVKNPTCVFTLVNRLSFFYLKDKIKRVISLLVGLYVQFKLFRSFNKTDKIIINTSVTLIPVIVSKLYGFKPFVFIREILSKKKLDFIIWRPLYFDLFKRGIIRVYNSKFCENFYQNLIGTGVVIPNIVPSPKSSKKTDGCPGVLRVGMVGRFCDQKGQKEILDYFLEFGGDMEFYFFGNVPKNIQERYLKYNAIHFYGEFSNVDLIYQEFDVLVNNALGETFGRVSIEAMQRGVLVIARNSGANNEILRNGEFGVLYDSVPELFEVINNIRLNDFNSMKYFSKEYSFRFLGSVIWSNYLKRLLC